MSRLSPSDSPLDYLSIDAVLVYLEQTGWTRVDHPNDRIILLEGPPDDAGNPLQLILPRDRSLDDAKARLAETIDLLAVLRQVSPEAIVQRIIGSAEIAASSAKHKPSTLNPSTVVKGKLGIWKKLRLLDQSKQRREMWIPIRSVAMLVIALLITIALVFIVYSQIKVSEKLRTNQRAYVGIASLKAYFDQGEIVIMLQNLGGVEAKQIQMSANAYLDSDKLYGDEALFDAGGVNLLPGGFQMPVLLKTQKYNPEEILAIDNKQNFFYVLGAVQYEYGSGVTATTTFAFKYKPPPGEDWIAVNSPVPKMLENLKRKADRLSHGPVIKITPSPLTSPVVSPTVPVASPTVPVASPTVPVASPTDKPSPLPNVSPSPPLRSVCRCTCKWNCDGTCSYQCTGCGLADGADAGALCCEQAPAAAPCPDKPDMFNLSLFKPRPFRGVLALIGLQNARVCN